MLKRKIYNDLVAWKQRSGGTTALLIDGARRVGKSFIAKEFAENEYRSHIIIDFGNVPKDVLDIFENDSTDLDMFLPSCPFSSEHSSTAESPSSCLTRYSSSPAHGSLSSTLWQMGATIFGNRFSHPAQEERQRHYHPLGGGASGDVPLGL